MKANTKKNTRNSGIPVPAKNLTLGGICKYRKSAIKNQSLSQNLFLHKWAPKGVKWITKMFKKGVNKKTRFFRVYTRFCCGTAHADSACTRGFVFNFLHVIF
jgi:hypothetical protein